jgi:hypothetical protein
MKKILKFIYNKDYGDIFILGFIAIEEEHSYWFNLSFRFRYIIISFEIRNPFHSEVKR